jgi:hypothetical protein
MRKMTSIPLALAIALALPLAAQAGVEWTTIGSTCTIETPSSSYSQYTGSGITYANLSSSTSTITIHCNVVTTQNSNSPGWTTIKIGWTGALSTNEIRAWVQEVNASGGSVHNTSSAVSNNTTGSGTNTSSLGAGFSFDFTTYAYDVIVLITRGTSGLSDLPEIVYISLS